MPPVQFKKAFAVTLKLTLVTVSLVLVPGGLFATESFASKSSASRTSAAASKDERRTLQSVQGVTQGDSEEGSTMQGAAAHLQGLIRLGRERITSFREGKKKREEWIKDLQTAASQMKQIREQREQDRKKQEAAFVQSRVSYEVRENAQAVMESEDLKTRKINSQRAESRRLAFTIEQNKLKQALSRGDVLNPAEEFNVYSRRNPYLEEPAQ
jgi:hypothetical protein